jgi:hypothetical protein
MLIDILSFVIYYRFTLNEYDIAQQIGMGELSFWGRSIVLLIPIIVGTRITGFVMYRILATSVVKEPEEKLLHDEMEKMIKLKATRNFSISFMLFFALIMGACYFGISLTEMFKYLLLSIFCSITILNFTAFYYTLKGI